MSGQTAGGSSHACVPQKESKLPPILVRVNAASPCAKVRPFDHTEPASTEPALRHIELTVERPTGSLVKKLYERLSQECQKSHVFMRLQCRLCTMLLLVQ